MTRIFVRRRPADRVLALIAGVAVLLTAALSAAMPVSAAATPSYLFKTGSAAASYVPPSDLHVVFSWSDAAGNLDFTRYQQRTTVNGNPVDVDGAQVTVVARNGQQVLVAGKYAQNTTPTAPVTVSVARAIAITSTNLARTSSAGDSATGSLTNVSHQAALMLDPYARALFYRVTSAAPGTLIYTKIDAATGAVIESWSGIEYAGASGTGVKGDTKTLAGDPLTGSEVLTSAAAGGWKLASTTGRFVTSDAAHSSTYPSAAMTDSDNVWSDTSEQPAVDAQYYAALTDHYYRTDRGFDLPACIGPIHSIVHYSRSYANAFWDPDARVMVYGDGDGRSFGEMSAAQDVVSHELTHAVTSCRADLDYKYESGALNEAFSDIMATAAEFEDQEPNSSNCRRQTGQLSCADWWEGEDLIVGGSDYAIRSLAHPQVLGQPSHYSQRAYQGKCTPGNFNDECGVHTNSGIANHAFYLMVNGGRNARCAGPTDSQADCDVFVPRIALDDAAHVFFDAWQGLTSGAQFCQAHDMTVAVADLLYPDAAHHAAADLAWRAVGVRPCGVASTFSIDAAAHGATAKQGGTANVSVSIARVSSSSPMTFSVSDPTPATASFQPATATSSDSSVTLRLDVSADAASGIYPMVVTANDGTQTQQLSIVLIVDADAPTATVSPARLATGDSVGADESVPLHVSWSTADATSGVVAGGLSVDNTSRASGVSGTATYASLDGTHDFQATATDAAGNTGSSSSMAVAQTSSQESAATYAKTWSAQSATQSWGTTRFSKIKGATATFAFNGTDVGWVSSRSPKRGKAKIYIDGVLAAKVDLYAATAAQKQIVFVASGLTDGSHTIKVFVNGTAGRPRVDVDGFVVLSQ